MPHGGVKVQILTAQDPHVEPGVDMRQLILHVHTHRREFVQLIWA